MKSTPQPAAALIWRNLVGVLLMHLGALVAFWQFTWIAFFAALVLGAITLQLGLILCFHRLLTHRSFKVPRWLEVALTLTGCLGFQAGPIAWVATHRYHHQHADGVEDPHSPKLSFFWAHIGWTLVRNHELDTEEAMRRLCPDLSSDRLLCWLQRNMTLINISAAAGLWTIGWMAGGGSLGWGLLLWGFCLRIVVVWHVCFLVNSAGHRWGYRTYDTRDESRNNWWVALLTCGEGWHNNHHADQRAAAHGHQWWEIDTTYMIIRALALLGLATKVVKASARLSGQRAARTRSGSH